MRAMVLDAPGQVALRDVGRPQPGPGETLIRVTHSGICGTDLKIFQGGIAVAYPKIMGHESIGEVVSGGDLKPGTLVIVDPATYCGACYNCRAGQTNICLEGGLIGRDVDGGFAEYMIAPAGNVHVMPAAIERAAAPLIQPMTTCLHAQRMVGIEPGEAVLIIGLGVTGLLHVQLAKAHGAYPVIGVTRSNWKRELAERLGADMTFALDDGLKESVTAVTGGRGPDVVIESVGQVALLAQAIDLVRTGGRIQPFGIYTETSGELPFYDLYFKEIQIINARVAKPEDYPACIDFVERGVVELAPLVSHTMGLGEITTALDMLDGGAPNRMKIILDHAG